jgi:hypothetical protein
VNLVVLSPKPDDATAKVNGYTMDNAGHYSVHVKFNMAVDTASVVVGKTLILRFSKDPNTAATITWSANGEELTVTTSKTRSELNTFNPDDSFTLTLVGTDAGSGVVKSGTSKILDGDYQGGPGGNYVMTFTLIG